MWYLVSRCLAAVCGWYPRSLKQRFAVITFNMVRLSLTVVLLIWKLTASDRNTQEIHFWYTQKIYLTQMGCLLILCCGGFWEHRTTNEKKKRKDGADVKNLTHMWAASHHTVCLCLPKTSWSVMLHTKTEISLMLASLMSPAFPALSLSHRCSFVPILIAPLWADKLIYSTPELDFGLKKSESHLLQPHSLINQSKWCFFFFMLKQSHLNPQQHICSHCLHCVFFSFSGHIVFVASQEQADRACHHT